jgi:hypothetical protein
MSLACLPPELSSSLDNIFLVSLFKTSDKNYFGNNVIFKDIFSELIYLETHGIFITSNNKVHHFLKPATKIILEIMLFLRTYFPN